MLKEQRKVSFNNTDKMAPKAKKKIKQQIPRTEEQKKTACYAVL
jgi:hypothetical protein